MNVFEVKNLQSAVLEKPWFVIQVIFFFLIHILKDHFRYISIFDLGVLFSYYIIGFSVLFVLVYVTLKSVWKTSLLVFFCQFVYFFFAPIHLWLKNISGSSFFSRYIFLLPLLLILLIGITFLIRNKSFAPKKAFLWINSTFLILIATDSIEMTIRFISKKPEISASKFNIKLSPIPVRLKRNIYYLVFDEYASSISLKQRFRFENPIDSLLTHKGFFVISKSISNYNFTPFSIASTLNMSYLEGFKKDSITAKEYEIVNSSIANNTTVNYLLSNRYNIINLSIFDFNHHPSKLKSSFLPTGTLLITRNTFFNHVLKDTEWFLYTRNSPFKFLYKKEVYTSKTNNEVILKQFEKKLTSDSSTFVYAHFVMPHPPFYYNSIGDERSVEEVLNEQLHSVIPFEHYLDNVNFTNKKIEWLINKIQSYEKQQAIIIIAGDHGYREKASGVDYFRNFNAVFLPETIKKGLISDSSSMVNEFRNIFNNAFNQKIPLLMDTTIFLEDYRH